jgi:(1->4)-alpha-D-glucan 1-alpha-D-glucosylmutase
MPDRNMEYLFYQTLFGAWPIEQDRLLTYMEKASREAKTFTSWSEPNAAYDEALGAFVIACCNDREFLDSVQAFLEPLIWPGRVNALSQVLLKLTAPGVPDLYQGTELWDGSLVDPDNRRPVNYDLRRKLLSELDRLSIDDILDRSDEGLPKLWLTRHALHLRRSFPAAFGPEGCYRPLPTQGAHADRVLGYTRAGKIAVVVPRLILGLEGGWKDTSVALPNGTWTSVLTSETINAGGAVPASDILARFPVALLVRED